MKAAKSTAQLFKNGGSQAIRLPKQFRFPGKSVTLQQTRGGVLIKSPINKSQSLSDAARAYEALLSDHPKERTAMEAWESAPLGE
jgi:antitoxin VapB